MNADRSDVQCNSRLPRKRTLVSDALFDVVRHTEWRTDMLGKWCVLNSIGVFGFVMAFATERAGNNSARAWPSKGWQLRRRESSPGTERFETGPSGAVRDALEGVTALDSSFATAFLPGAPASGSGRRTTGGADFDVFSLVRSCTVV